jgi:gamma-glutamylcysteine synthetase
LSKLQQRLDALPPAVLRGIRRGIEKEGLRVRPDGTLALTPHPPGSVRRSRTRASPPTSANRSSN